MMWYNVRYTRLRCPVLEYLAYGTPHRMNDILLQYSTVLQERQLSDFPSQHNGEMQPSGKHRLH